MVTLGLPEVYPGLTRLVISVLMLKEFCPIPEGAGASDGAKWCPGLISEVTLSSAFVLLQELAGRSRFASVANSLGLLLMFKGRRRQRKMRRRLRLYTLLADHVQELVLGQDSDAQLVCLFKLGRAHLVAGHQVRQFT